MGNEDWAGRLHIRLQGVGVMHWLNANVDPAAQMMRDGSAVFGPLVGRFIIVAAKMLGPESSVEMSVIGAAPAPATTQGALTYALEALAEVPDADLLEDASIEIAAQSFYENRLPRRFSTTPAR